MNKAYTPQVGTTCEPLGITIRAENIPPGSKKIWKLLNQVYDATAIFIWGNTSITYFRDIDQGLDFDRMMEESMAVPEITDRIYQTRAGFMSEVESLTSQQQRNNETEEKP